MIARSVTTFTQDQFDLLWEDCRAHVVGGTMPTEDADECKSQVFNSMNSQPIKMAVADSQSKDISYLTGYKSDDDHFYVMSGLHGNDTDGSKAWLYSSDYWSTIRQWVVDNDMTAYAGEMVKDASAYNHLLTISDLGVYPNATFSVSNIQAIPALGFTRANICFLHTE